MKLTGYVTERGVGVRDLLVVMPSVGCTNRTVELIGRTHADVRFLTHQHGCGQIGNDLRLTSDVLARICANPNVREAIVVGLGCESNQPAELARRARHLGAAVRHTIVQSNGGAQATAERMAPVIDAMASGAAHRVAIEAAQLTVGLMADAASGPRGAELVAALSARLRAEGMQVLDGGQSSGNGILGGGEALTVHGAWARRLPMHVSTAAEIDHVDTEVEAMTLLAARGAQMCVFVTGRANPAGSPVMPTLKVGTDPRLVDLIEDVHDLDGSERIPLDRVVEAALGAIEATVNGLETRAEQARQRDFGIPRLAPTM